MHWLLPDGVEEWLPPDSWCLENLRRTVLDVFSQHGFELILPPLLEYTESLLSGVGKGLDRRTFTLVDQNNGRQLGLRADITPQAARIDANRYAQDSVAVRRLCYLGTVLRTQADEPGGSRSLRQLGAEVFGHSGLEADVAVISLMCDVLSAAQLGPITLDLGNVGIVRAILPPDLEDSDRQKLLAAVQRKAPGEVTEIAAGFGVSAHVREELAAICDLHGPADVVQARRDSLPEHMRRGIDELLDLSAMLARRYPQHAQHLDCAELSGFHYETGVTWAAYTTGSGQAIARGGRYDGIGSVFGADRPATGFSANLDRLAVCSKDLEVVTDVIWAPAGDKADLLQAIDDLRRQGRRVRQVLPTEPMGTGAQLVFASGQWIVEENNS